MIDLFTLAFAAPLFALLGAEARKAFDRRRAWRRAIAGRLPPGTGPYRDAPAPAPQPVATWTVLSIASPSQCRFCGCLYTSGSLVSLLSVSKPCTGRPGACPTQMTHHHVRCRNCKREWLEGSPTHPDGGTSS